MRPLLETVWPQCPCSSNLFQGYPWGKNVGALEISFSMAKMVSVMREVRGAPLGDAYGSGGDT